MMKTYQKIKTHVQVMQFTGGRENADEIRRWVGAGSVWQPPSKIEPREFMNVPTMWGPRDIKVGEYIVKIEENTFLPYKPEALASEYVEVKDEEDFRLIQHARRELAGFPEEDPDFIESIIASIKGFCSYRGHSGGSADIAIHMVTALLRGENLLPLTNDPEEWLLHKGETYGVDYDMWQNKRNSKAISEDGGKTYWLVSDPVEEGGVKHIYTAQDKDFKPEIQEEDLLSDDEKASE